MHLRRVYADFHVEHVYIHSNNANSIRNNSIATCPALFTRQKLVQQKSSRFDQFDTDKCVNTAKGDG